MTTSPSSPPDPSAAARADNIRIFWSSTTTGATFGLGWAVVYNDHAMRAAVVFLVAAAGLMIIRRIWGFA